MSSEEIGTPRDWLDRAHSNLLRAKQNKPEGVFWEDLCFDAQQAVEKSLKAVLLARKIAFRFIHDVAALLTLLERSARLFNPLNQNYIDALETIRASRSDPR